MKFLKIEDVLAQVPICRTLWYKLIKEGIAPPPIKFGERSAAWTQEDIDRFIEDRIRLRDAA
ncbi:AlpA family phage regulatory protein [Alkalimonas sp. MEB108]|uniref:AlpA family phage regulatory protein n=1 Tax=Alkalimonas cellulosilytica TaxID=3058395 RepID=A0ABU7J1G7_9GAMM|nr:AlpA family phage regulatory protein [Alkalimonas sp. MEB108]MEE2000182.1 AlpA family phage regulatory protein [Alkalimonas sp. MEB108]